jgi:hypothetical protein
VLVGLSSPNHQRIPSVASIPDPNSAGCSLSLSLSAPSVSVDQQNSLLRPSFPVS